MNKLLSISALIAACAVATASIAFTSFGTYDRYKAHTKQKEALFNSYFNVCVSEVERKGYDGGYPEREILELRKACGVGAKAFADNKADYTALGRSWTFDKEAQMYVETFK
jgi:hypothetical protein